MVKTRRFSKEIWLNEKSFSNQKGICARDWIRTSTTFRMLPPEDSASTNFATRAELFEVRGLMFNTHNPVPQAIWTANIRNQLTSNLKPRTSNLELNYTLTLKSLSASFKLVFRSVLGLRCPIINAQPTPNSPAGNFFA